MTSVAFRIPTTIPLMIVWCALSVRTEKVEIVTPENAKIPPEETKNVTAPSNDSYVRAYEEIQKLRSGPAKRLDPEKEEQGTYDTVVRSTHVPDDKYPSLTHPWMPAHDAAPPPLPPTYGPPHYRDASPAPPVYGPPHFHDASPAPPVYGPPHFHEPAHHHHPAPPTHCHPIPYSSPSTSFLGFLPKKLSFKLLVKILLKLVLFKMIVKFIAVICLLLFIPLLKSKETSAEGDDDRRHARELDALSNMIWGGIESKNFLYGADGEMKDVGEIAQQLDDDDEGDNYFSGPIRAVRFLEFCVSTVDRVVGVILGVLNRQRNEGDYLSSFLLDKLKNFVKSL